MYLIILPPLENAPHTQNLQWFSSWEMSRKQWITVVLRSTEEKKAQKDSEKSFAWNQQHKFIRAALGGKKNLEHPHLFRETVLKRTAGRHWLEKLFAFFLTVWFSRFNWPKLWHYFCGFFFLSPNKCDNVLHWRKHKAGFIKTKSCPWLCWCNVLKTLAVLWCR